MSLVHSGHSAAATGVQSASTSAMASAAGVLALLDENDDRLKALALQRLDSMVALHWMEIASKLPDMYGASQCLLVEIRLLDLRCFLRS